MFGRRHIGKKQYKCKTIERIMCARGGRGYGNVDLGEIQPNMIPSFPGNKKLSHSIL